VSLTPPVVSSTNASLLRAVGLEWSGEQKDMLVVTEPSALESTTHVISHSGGVCWSTDAAIVEESRRCLGPSRRVGLRVCWSTDAAIVEESRRCLGPSRRVGLRVCWSTDAPYFKFVSHGSMKGTISVNSELPKKWVTNLPTGSNKKVKAYVPILLICSIMKPASKLHL
jgi:hypothetical protein